MTLEYDRNTTAETVCETFHHNVKGKPILVTGPSITGLGYAAAAIIAKFQPKTIIFLGRNEQKLIEAKESLFKINPELECKTIECDLTSLIDVKKAAKEVLELGLNVDVFIANAGVMNSPYTITQDGFEVQLQTNYLSQFVLITQLLPLILKSELKRVIMLNSAGVIWAGVQWEDPNYKKNEYDGHAAYAQSKTAMTLFARYLAKHYGDKGLSAYSVCPGAIPTEVGRYYSAEMKVQFSKTIGQGCFFDDGSINYDSAWWSTPSQGVAVVCRAAFEDDLQPNGAFLKDCIVDEEGCPVHCKDPELVEKVWGWTNELLGESLSE
ncbi:hypothetical protein TREMEDRAFT_74423 [Tremella mesenterica DSM 1558]|uniref:uncharacterized protein n=1 Tax=Tremella mesenterica (strain ATCC 24925 / CBS 8224 / DSM 1558 / NBRC 9311 / NRRL Y-6157 / RJB 2259-6 / UBC 559-6) TaxID=578456 RepID=UPI0003F4A431|nr:uncharacterized protein TREMEDRAFT_74423 [Tremella mesenterica DSM 1558]EIW68123.1 hypothetical protein TREMEDRAFT_74423 [Tremella mesenterica DSM 1558]